VGANSVFFQVLTLDGALWLIRSDGHLQQKPGSEKRSKPIAKTNRDAQSNDWAPQAPNPNIAALYRQTLARASVIQTGLVRGAQAGYRSLRRCRPNINLMILQRNIR
jgi:hypothetical protein